LGLKTVNADKKLGEDLKIYPLKFGMTNHSNTSCFGYGVEPECWSDIDPQSFSHVPRLKMLIGELQWRETLPGGEFAEDNKQWFARLKANIDSETEKTKGTSLVSKHERKSMPNVSSVEDARSYVIATFNQNSIHTSQYTIRMNTWHRNEQLLISINHHAKCEGVASIQIIWCDDENEPPDEVVHHKSGKVVIERHEINSLNERYRILEPTPTIAVLSLDDDVLRPCEALDAAFIRWTRHPDRIVGFYARSHVNPVNSGQWGYNTIGKTNQYSITLPTKSCFIHRDYLDLYMAALPKPIHEHIDASFNCEDIAMSYFVSAMTEGKPPLLSDHWAIHLQLQVYSQNGLSWKGEHIVSLTLFCISLCCHI
jgi:hypothetical protein